MDMLVPEAVVHLIMDKTGVDYEQADVATLNVLFPQVW
jgi:hypothetical protein